MCRYLFLLAFLLVGVGGCDGDEFVIPRRDQSPMQPASHHVPQITELAVSPQAFLYMDGGGTVVVTAEISFSDAGRDIQALWIRMPDGTSLGFGESFTTETGTFTKDITLPTNQFGEFSVNFWLVDQAGDQSGPVPAEFVIGPNVQDDNWTERVSGLPSVLVDVVWNGNVFVAVGGDGAIFTSQDGINWMAIDSGTDADLHAVAADGPYVVAVGREAIIDRGVVLQSTDNGVTWSVKDISNWPIESGLDAVAIGPSQIVVGGSLIDTAITMISEDRGDTWRAVDSWPNEDLHISDLVYGDGMFIAATNGGQVAVSSDGKVWSEIEVSDIEWTWLRTIIHDDSQFILAGSLGKIFTSWDGFNWTQLQTPVPDVSYTGVAWNGSRLVLAGESMCGPMWSCDPQYAPVGLSSSDGGTSWEIFNIGSDYASKGLAWGNGRFVSVGEKPAFLGDGAIYTSD